MSEAFHIKINPEDLKKVEQMLGHIKGMVPKVISRAYNDTMKGVKTDTASEIYKVINISSSSIKKCIQIHPSSPSSLAGSVEITGRLLPLLAFGAKKTQRGVSVKVRRDAARKVIPGTFIATVKSEAQRDIIDFQGHEGVFWRKWHGSTGKLSKIDRQIGRSGYVFNSKTGRYFPVWALPKRYRLPIEERYGPSIPDYMGNKGPIQGIVLGKAGDRMHKNIDRELNYELSKL